MQRTVFYLIVMLALLVPMCLKALTLDDFTIMTEEYPPYNFEQNGVVKGMAIEMMSELMKRTNCKKTAKDIQVLPWARSYKDVQEKPNTILFSMTRSKEREPLFKWVGPISPTKIVLFAKKAKKIKINSPADIKNYPCGAIRDDIGHQLLTKAGITNIDLTADMGSNIKKLDTDRITLWAYEENVAKWEMKNTIKNYADFESVYTLLSADLYIAFNKNTPDAFIQQLQKVFDSMKKDGTIQKIMDKY